MKKIIPFLTICMFTSLIIANTVIAGDFKSIMNDNNNITDNQTMNLQLNQNTISSKCTLSYYSCKKLQPKYDLTAENLYGINYLVNNCLIYNSIIEINTKNEQLITESQAPTTQVTPETKAIIPAPETNETQTITRIQPTTKAQVISKPPITTPTPTTSAPKQNLDGVDGKFNEFQRKVVELVNKERAAIGLNALTEEANIDKVATIKSEDMVNSNYFSHTSPTYGSPFEMLKHFNISYSTAGENIAYGQSTPEQVMDGWMNSPGHRANILNTNFTQIGIGVAIKANGQLVWTQQFIRP